MHSNRKICYKDKILQQQINQQRRPMSPEMQKRAQTQVGTNVAKKFKNLILNLVKTVKQDPKLKKLQQLLQVQQVHYRKC